MFSFFKKKEETVPVMLVATKENFGRVPTRGHNSDAGLDLYLTGSLNLKARQGRTFPIGLYLCIPEGHVGLILPRSSISFRGIHVCTGVVDAGFVGEIQITVNNMTNMNYHFEAGDRIAQLVVVPIASLAPVKVKPEDLVIEAAKFSDRGEHGYGSTGK